MIIKIDQLIKCYYEKSPVSDKDKLVIETGFNIFFFQKYCLDYKANSIYKLMINQKKVIKNNILPIKRSLEYLNGTNIFDIFFFLFEFIISTINLMSLCLKYVIFILTCGKIINSFDIKSRFTNKIINDENSTNFFEENSRSIEILRNNQVYKIYFIMLPFCQSITEVKLINKLDW